MHISPFFINKLAVRDLKNIIFKHKVRLVNTINMSVISHGYFSVDLMEKRWAIGKANTIVLIVPKDIIYKAPKEFSSKRPVKVKRKV